MGSPLVLKLPNADKESDGPILLRIEQSNEQRLDLQLFATDGESVFVGKTRHSTVEKLKNTSFGGSLEEWQTILFATLSQQAKALASPVAEHIELAASVGDNLLIVIRRNVDGITQRLGGITLKQKDDEEISLFDWALDSAAETAKLQNEMKGSQRKLEEKDAVIEAQRKEMTEAESKHKIEIEQYMLKFSEVLDTKKLHNRNKQRQLAGEDRNISNGQHLTQDNRPSSDGIRTSQKRTAGQASEEAQVNANDENDDMETDTEMSEGSVRAQQKTPDPESATSSEDEGEPELAVEASSHTVAESQADGHNLRSGSERRTLPPRRDLPFNKPPQVKQTSASPDAAEDGDETDDEL